ncbi:MAG: hypothetical protein VB013_05270 [Anaerolineaceae bacterium]|nr:hypothetical protein [Anaerolineaceae bacterium]
MNNKWVLRTIVFIMTIALVAAVIPGSASAKKIDLPGVADGNWTIGTETAMDLSTTTYPSWLQVMDTNVTVIPAAAQICHPFRGGQFGWVADIRQLVGSEWMKVTTTQGLLAGNEGVYMACAAAPAAGTYGFFAYFDESKAPKTSFNQKICQYKDWVAYFWYHDDSYEWDPGYSLEIHLATDPEGFPTGKAVKYQILDTYPIPGLEGLPRTGTTTSWDDGEIYATFTDYIYDGDFDAIPDFTNRIKVTTGGCSYILPLSNQTYEDIFD